MSTLKTERLFWRNDSIDGFADHTAKRHWNPDRTFTTDHIAMDLYLDIDGKQVKGTVTHHIRPVNHGFREFELDAIQLNIHQITDHKGNLLDFSTSDDKLHIDLGRAYRQRQQIAVTIEYDAHPRYGMFFVHPDEGYPDKEKMIWTQGESVDNRHWLPIFDFPNDKCTTEAKLTIAKPYTALSNGGLVETVENEDGTRTFHWKQDVPHPTYLIVVIAGEFDEKTDYFEDIPLPYWVPKGLADQIEDCFGKTPHMVEFFSKCTGVRYPHAKYGQVVVRDFTFGGMEDTSLTVMIETILHDKAAHPDVWHRSEGLVAHELAHQWYGDHITIKNFEHLWVKEGFASYFDPLWFEDYYGKDMFDWRMIEEQDEYLASPYFRPIVTNKYHHHVDMYDTHSYNKGACVLHMLRFYLGDELWWKGIQYYTRKFAGKIAETTDLRIAFEEATGKSLDWFFRQWVYRAGHPEFEVKWEWKKELKMAVVSITQKQAENEQDEEKIYRTPLEIAVTTGERTQMYRVDLEKREQTFYFPASKKPDMIVFDPNSWLTKTLEFKKSKKEALYQLKHATTVAGRRHACQELGKINGDMEVVEALKTAMLTDSFFYVSMAAAKALGNLRSEAARDALFAALDHDHSWVRRAAIAALGEFKHDDSVFKKLKKVIKKDGSYFAVAAAIQSIAKIDVEGAYKTILKGLERDSHRDVIRTAVLNGIVELREKAGIPVLKEWAAYGKPVWARLAAIMALGRLADKLDDETKTDVREFLIPLLDDNYMFVRRMTISALAALGDPNALRHLEKLATSDPADFIRRAIRNSVREIRQKAGRKHLKADFETELGSLHDENKTLKERLAKLEEQVKAMADGKK